jgi:hypothetical protein
VRPDHLVARRRSCCRYVAAPPLDHSKPRGGRAGFCGRHASLRGYRISYAAPPCWTSAAARPSSSSTSAVSPPSSGAGPDQVFVKTRSAHPGSALGRAECRPSGKSRSRSNDRRTRLPDWTATRQVFPVRGTVRAIPGSVRITRSPWRGPRVPSPTPAGWMPGTIGKWRIPLSNGRHLGATLRCRVSGRSTGGDRLVIATS